MTIGGGAANAGSGGVTWNGAGDLPIAAHCPSVSLRFPLIPGTICLSTHQQAP